MGSEHVRSKYIRNAPDDEIGYISSRRKTRNL